MEQRNIISIFGCSFNYLEERENNIFFKIAFYERIGRKNSWNCHKLSKNIFKYIQIILVIEHMIKISFSFFDSHHISCL